MVHKTLFLFKSKYRKQKYTSENKQYRLPEEEEEREKQTRRKRKKKSVTKMDFHSKMQKLSAAGVELDLLSSIPPPFKMTCATEYNDGIEKNFSFNYKVTPYGSIFCLFVK